MSWYMKKPCEHCPFRNDVKPFLRPERGSDLAYSATNPYNSFPCHKTTVSDDDSEDGEMLVTGTTKECAGFMTLQHIECDNSLPKGFEPAYDIVYNEAFTMSQAYEDQDI